MLQLRPLEKNKNETSYQKCKKSNNIWIQIKFIYQY